MSCLFVLYVLLCVCLFCFVCLSVLLCLFCFVLFVCSFVLCLLFVCLFRLFAFLFVLTFIYVCMCVCLIVYLFTCCMDLYIYIILINLLPCSPLELLHAGILQKVRTKYEDHHNMDIPDEVLAAVVGLSEQYIKRRSFPDKALDLLDESCAMRRVRFNNRVAEVGKQLEDHRAHRVTLVSIVHAMHSNAFFVLRFFGLSLVFRFSLLVALGSVYTVCNAVCIYHIYIYIYICIDIC